MAKKYGNQVPRVGISPQYEYTDGNDAAELVKAYGYDLDPWQKTVINSWLGRDKTDKFTATACGLSVPRQNGKNALLEVRELYGIVTMGEAILHTAHEVKTARQAFNRLAAFFSDEKRYPELANMVKQIRRTNGQEEIELINGGAVKFSSRSNGANRGFTVDSVIFDEAQELTEEQFNALLPTLSAAPSGNRQFIYTGTPPTSSVRGEAFARIRKSAIEGLDSKCSWYEWSIEKIPPRDITLKELLKLAQDTNPALGYRLTKEFTKQEALQMSFDGFARERLGFWTETSTTRAISEALWSKTFIEQDKAPKDGLITFGVKFSPDGAFVSIAGCKHEDGNAYHVELISCAPIHEAFSFMKEFFNDKTRIEKTAGIAIDGRNGLGMLVNMLSENYYRQVIMIPSTKGCIDASAMFEQALYDGDVTHTNGKHGEQNELTNSALSAIKRPVGHDGGWIYGGETSTPLEAVALALWANKTTKIDPNRKAVVW